MKLSIIVPVYNVQQYIIACIKSLLDHDTDDYEIIVVNDGTKDNSIELIRQEFCDDRLVIVEQVNSGLSAARNKGVELAKGDYIWFVDSDDWIESHSVDWIIKEINTSDFDILYQPYTYEYRNGNVSVVEKKFFYDIKAGADVLKLSACATCAQFYIVKRSFWLANNFHFYVGILHEDNELMYKVIYSAKRVKCISKPIYYHNIRPGSITQTFNPKRCYSLKIVCDSLYCYLMKNVKKEDMAIFARYLLDALYAMLDAAKDGDLKIKHEINSYLSNNSNILFLLWKYGNLKAKFFYCACVLSKHHYVQMCSFFRKIHK